MVATPAQSFFTSQTFQEIRRRIKKH